MSKDQKGFIVYGDTKLLADEGIPYAVTEDWIRPIRELKKR